MPLPVASPSLPVLLTQLSATSPAAGFLRTLTTRSSQRSMAQALAVAADLLAPGALPAPAGRGRKGNATERLNVACALPWASIRVDRLGELRAQLVGKGYAPATANKVMAAVRGVLAQCWRSGQLDVDSLARAKATLSAVKGSTLPAGRHVKRAELRKLFEACLLGRGAAPARDATLLALLATGLRREEVAKLSMGDYDPASCRLVVHGKGRKERSIFLTNGARDAMCEWLLIRGRSDGPLLRQIGKSGNILEGGLSAQAIYSRLRLLSRHAGVACSPHDLRRTMAGDALDAGIDIVTLQSIMGHASPSTTSQYDRRPEAKKREAMGLLSLPYKRP